MEKKAKSTEVDDQLHAIWSVSSSLSAYIQATDGFCGKRFCFVLNKSRPLLKLETRFFETARAGKGLLSFHLSSPRLTLYSTCHRDIYQVR